MRNHAAFNGMAGIDIGIVQQAMKFFLDHVVAFASVGLQTRPVKYGDVTPAVN